ncbi:MAG TPA: ribose 5-phosphate isomerase B [Lacipirellulaceae bacterium]|nr:ribose 5-phosphate isomerase B [Lacipirellulaceae bacterium]
MKLAFGCDHAGFALKMLLMEEAKQLGNEIIDCGAMDDQPSDYPDFARAVGKAVLSGQAERAVLICGSGAGASVAANKLRGIRAGLCHDTYSAHQAVEHDNINVLCLGSRVVGEALASELMRVFLQARFSGEERHMRRLKKVAQIENEEQELHVE